VTFWVYFRLVFVVTLITVIIIIVVDIHNRNTILNSQRKL